MNIILFSLDTVRPDRLGCYGCRRATSANLDRIAAEGTVFADYHSPHIPTYPGHTTMMTGRDVYSHHVTGQSNAYPLSPEIPTLAELFRGQGWFTAAADSLGKWFTRGFDLCEGYSWDTPASGGWRKGEAVTAAALKALNRAANQKLPFFLFIHYWDAHTPYLPPAPFDRMYYEADAKAPDLRSMDPVWDFEPFSGYFHEWMPGVTDIEFPKAQYDAEIAYMDACLAHVLTRLEELRIIDETMLVFTADHGEELDEHGCWFDHHGLYDTNTHVPLIIRLPGVVPAGVRVRGLARMTDLAPTLLDYAGLTGDHGTSGVKALSEAARAMDGVSLRPMALGGDCPVDMLHLTENTWMKKRAVRTSEWKLIRALEPDLHGFPPVELYRLADDPGERHNLADELPQIVDELTAEMDEHVGRRTAAVGLPDPLPLQPVPLKRVGGAPAPRRRARSAAPAVEPHEPRPDERSGDRKLADGDFVGYVRDEP